MPKYLQKIFEKKGTTTINPEHKKFVDWEINYMLKNNYKETGSRYNSEIGGEYRAFKIDGKFYIVILYTNYYIIEN